MSSVRDVLDERNGIAPGFGLMRHALSIMILIEHCYIIGLGKFFNVGYTKNDLMGQAERLTGKQLVIEGARPLMFYLVGAFFVLSGFLVFGSALRNKNLKDFFVLRLIRLLPALAVEVTISALIIGPLVTSYALGDYFTDQSFFAYFGNIVGLIRFDLPGVFKTNPTPNWVNANLWTLPSELECYVILGASILLGITKNRLAFLGTILCVSITIFTLHHFDLFDLRGSNVAYSARYIVFLFFCGVLAYMYCEYIPVSKTIFVVSIFAYYICNVLNIPDIVSAPFLVYTVLFIGMSDLSRFDKWLGGDYSYGIYLYGYPLTQMVMYYLSDRLENVGAMQKVVILASIAVPLTCAVAFLSWHLIERHCLKLRKVLVKRPTRPPEPSLAMR